MDNIFKPFGRLHSKSTYAGTGIGLALCKRVVEIHKGFIDVDSDGKAGTTFTVYIPINKKNGHKLFS
ncbi:ATP-binding protein [Costertonia aggregata]|uniref:ATP-binding protein n=1 Tax=Costertonia aggregata TaxID=343403 RepID=UPI0021D1ECF0|nr:ATP-binding protein [Costertonia aggregata]